LASPTPPTADDLTAASYTLSNGVYSQTFGSIVVNFVISDEPSTGNVTVEMNGDSDPTDIAAAQASLASLDYVNIVLTNAGGLQSYGQSL
jgi:hypothetical protein